MSAMILLVFGRDEPDRPLGWLGWCHQFAQRIEHLLELGTGVEAERVVRQRDALGLLFQLI